jgi:hypothetical protein
MNTRAEIIAFQMVQNMGYEEAMKSILTKIDFMDEYIDDINLKESIRIGVDSFRVSKTDLNLLYQTNKSLGFIMRIYEEILKYGDN